MSKLVFASLLAAAIGACVASNPPPPAGPSAPPPGHSGGYAVATAVGAQVCQGGGLCNI